MPVLESTTAAHVSAIIEKQPLLYVLLLLAMGYWAFRGLWLYVWDEFVWIAGFAVIEMNVSEWRDELLDEAV